MCVCFDLLLLIEIKKCLSILKLARATKMKMTRRLSFSLALTV